MSLVPAAAVILSAATACITDLRARRIPNWLTFGSAAVAVAAHVMMNGWAGAQHAVAGWIVGTLLFLPLFALRGMGGGDVKLLAALGAWLGTSGVFWLAIYTSLAGGLIGLIVALRHRYLRILMGNLSTLFRFWWLAGPRPLPALTLEGASGPRLAYAVPMFIGALVTLWRH